MRSLVKIMVEILVPLTLARKWQALAKTRSHIGTVYTYIYILYKYSKIVAPIVALHNWFKLVYGQFEQSNMHSNLDFYPRQARNETNVLYYIRKAKSLLS